MRESLKINFNGVTVKKSKIIFCFNSSRILLEKKRLAFFYSLIFDEQPSLKKKKTQQTTETNKQQQEENILKQTNKQKKSGCKEVWREKVEFWHRPKKGNLKQLTALSID